MSSLGNPQPISLSSSVDVDNVKRLVQSMDAQQLQQFLQWLYETQPDAWSVFLKVFAKRFAFRPVLRADLNPARMRTCFYIAQSFYRNQGAWPLKFRVKQTSQSDWIVAGRIEKVNLARVWQARKARAAPKLLAAAQSAAQPEEAAQPLPDAQPPQSAKQAEEILVENTVEVFGRCAVCCTYILDRQQEHQFIARCCAGFIMLCKRCKAGDKCSRTTELAPRSNAKHLQQKEYRTEDIRAGKLDTSMTCLHGCVDSKGNREKLLRIPTSVCSQLRCTTGEKPRLVVQCDFCHQLSPYCLVVWLGEHCVCSRLAWMCEGCWKQKGYTPAMVKNKETLMPCPVPDCSSSRMIVAIQTLTQVSPWLLPQTLADAQEENAALSRYEEPDEASLELARQRRAAQVQEIRKNAQRDRFIESLKVEFYGKQSRVFWDAVQKNWCGEVTVDEEEDMRMTFSMPRDSEVAASTRVKQEDPMEQDSQDVGGSGGAGGSAQR